MAKSREGMVYARVNPASVLIEERFAYNQVISRNPTIGRRPSPVGRIKIKVPYDGRRYFTRDGLDDVERAHDRARNFVRSRYAAIGSLIFVGHQETDLAKVLGISGRFGAYTLKVPIRKSPLDSPECLASDQYEHAIDVRYAPSIKRPRALPLVLDVEVLDRDYSTLMWTQRSLEALLDESKNGAEKVADDILQSVSFSPHLILRITVKLALAPRLEANPIRPRIRRISIYLPSVSSISTQSVELKIAGNSPQLHVDLRRNVIEWFDCTMRAAPAEGGEEGLRRFTSQQMELTFRPESAIRRCGPAGEMAIGAQ
ncbi:MAG: hypothetical protein JOY78_13280 [Pseudonocardia sp.]|nr:hypothetical protein [Pseudonocardia sp.]